MRGQIRFLAVLLFWAFTVPLAQADDSKMTHIVFQIVDSTLPEDHFALTPREMWRVGTQYLRIEEAPDPKRKIHGLVIVDEPDIHIINRYYNKSQHIVDPGPTFEMHMPVFPSHLPKEISKLEFGNELEFFQLRNARTMPSVKMNGKNHKTSMLKIDGADLVLITEEASGKPVQISVEFGKESFATHYKTYETGLEIDMNLFKVPEGVKIIEAKGRPAK
jgi:hypothetical protein